MTYTPSDSFFQALIEGGSISGDHPTATETSIDSLDEIVARAWEEETKDAASHPPSISFSTESVPAAEETYQFDKGAIVKPSHRRQTKQSDAHDSVIEAKLKAVVQILASFRLLDNLSKKKQEKLLSAIYQVLSADEG